MRNGFLHNAAFVSLMTALMGVFIFAVVGNDAFYVGLALTVIAIAFNEMCRHHYVKHGLDDDAPASQDPHPSLFYINRIVLFVFALAGLALMGSVDDRPNDSQLTALLLFSVAALALGMALHAASWLVGLVRIARASPPVLLPKGGSLPHVKRRR